VKLLICEGACNHGGVQRYDANVAEYGRDFVPREEAKRLKHTAHEPVHMGEFGRFSYACQSCGVVRRYGHV